MSKKKSKQMAFAKGNCMRSRGLVSVVYDGAAYKRKDRFRFWNHVLRTRGQRPMKVHLNF